MALIKCPECGNTISDKATTCPHCGCPLTEEPEIETAVFCLRREKKAFFCAVRYEVYLDNQYWGVLNNGDSLTAELMLGTHHLKLIDKNNFNKTVFDADFAMDDNLTFTFSAAMNVSMKASSSSSNSVQASRSNSPSRAMPVAPAPPVRVAAPASSAGGRRCPRCSGIMAIQTVSEARKSGCGTILLYVLLALTIFGLLIVVPLMLRKKTETVTYAVCQSCGYKKRIS